MSSTILEFYNFGAKDMTVYYPNAIEIKSTENNSITYTTGDVKVTYNGSKYVITNEDIEALPSHGYYKFYFTDNLTIASSPGASTFTIVTTPVIVSQYVASTWVVVLSPSQKLSVAYLNSDDGWVVYDYSKVLTSAGITPIGFILILVFILIIITIVGFSGVMIYKKLTLG